MCGNLQMFIYMAKIQEDGKKDLEKEKQYLVAGSPPTDDILLCVNSVVQVVKVHSIGEISLHLTLRFLVRYAEAVRHLDDSLLRGTCQ